RHPQAHRRDDRVQPADRSYTVRHWPAARPIRKPMRLRILCALGLLLCVGWIDTTSAWAQERGANRVRLRLEVPPAGQRGPAAAAERAVLDAFIRAHPDIRIEPFVRLRMEGPRAEATLYMSIAGQTAPDVLYVNARS